MNQNHSSNAPLASINSAEIKEEPNIKEEPVPVGELIDIPVPVWNSRSVVFSFDVDRTNDENDFYDLDFDDGKVEVKEEDKEKKEEESKIDDKSAEDAMENQNDQQQSSPQDEANFPTSKYGHGAKSTNDCSKIDDLENAVKKHKCGICEYASKRSGDLKKHLVKHTSEKLHGCGFCLKRFASKRYLRNHMKVHVEEFLFHCPDCLQGFDVENEKIEHETNCKIRRYECHLCKKSFRLNKASMMIHMRVHSGNKPFGCGECFKHFTNRSSLNTHMKLHAGLRLFRCSNCHVGFSHEEERNAHEENCNRPVFECDVCGKSFGLNKSGPQIYLLFSIQTVRFQSKATSQGNKTYFSAFQFTLICEYERKNTFKNYFKDYNRL